MSVPPLPESVSSQAQQHFANAHATLQSQRSSSLEKAACQVLRALPRIVGAIEEEVLVDGLYSVDFRVHLTTAERVLVDVDGPTHDIECLATGQRRLDGSTRFKEWLLQASARELFVRFSHKEWNAARTMEQKQQLLTRLLDTVRGRASALQPPAHAIPSGGAKQVGSAAAVSMPSSSLASIDKGSVSSQPTQL